MDIRSFFGGKPAQSSGSSQKEKKTPSKSTTPAKTGKKRKSRVIGIDALIHANIDSDEDDSDKYDFCKGY